ncbi:MAG: malectin domain-containing carbohydrate-binding protein [Calditrichia bacterium]
MRSLKLLPWILALVIYALLQAGQIIEVPDSGWRLWPDTAAAWENDDIYLPDEVDLARLPVNPPSGGWEALNSSHGIEITLPSPVEEHFWGAFGYRPYKNEYYFETEDPQVKNGNYKGVSWWWHTIDIPADFKGKKVILHIRGARLRAEVYLNEKLVGYSIINETAFNCDLSEAMLPGEKNLLAIRITNPGGEMDWVDTRYLTWGKYRFHSSHGFGGLDRGMTIRAHDPVYVNDLWAMNTPKTATIKAQAKLTNASGEDIKGTITYEIIDPSQADKVVSRIQKPFKINGNMTLLLDEALSYPDAQLWDPDHPNLYRLRANIQCTSASTSQHLKDTREVTFGFRWFEADGIGNNAVLRLNGKRLRLISAISWGFWGMNGLWPSPALAEKEVKDAKAFGMNCIQFHRNVGKTEVLDAQDRLGLLRYMEPGGGQTALGEEYTLYADSPKKPLDTSGKQGDAKTFAEKYMEAKIMQMVRDHRRHPSLVLYSVQNEINPDLKNPRVFRIIRRIHQEDPSRIVVLKSGIPPVNQVWMQPYDTTIYCDRGNGYSGWWDRHTVGGPGVWLDNMYKNPQDFTHHSDNRKEIVTWGEMLGAAVPDNHTRLIRQIKANGGESYDLKDHLEVEDAYAKFLDRWGFRQAFPTDESLFLSIGNKCYDFWGRVIETARLSDENDFLVISGWESTSIENHSGLVDNLRNFKGNPELLHSRFAHLRPVIKPRALVVAAGEKDTMDIFLLNETNQPASKTLQLSMISPDSGETAFGSYSVPKWKKDCFVYPIAEALTTPPLTKEGRYLLKLMDAENSDIFSEETLLVVNTHPEVSQKKQLGVITHIPEMIGALNNYPGIRAEKYQPGHHYDLILATTRLLQGWRSVVDSTTEISGTDDDRLFHTESWGYNKNLEYIFSDLPKGKARVTLRFAEVTLSGPENRVFDVAINGKTVLDDFDVFKTAGGKNIAIDTSFIVDAPAGVIKITIPEHKINYAKFSAIKITAGDTVIAINCGGEPYRDKNGLVWQTYGQKLNIDGGVIQKVKEGTPLLLIPDGSEAADAYAKLLGKAGAYDYLGHVGNVRASWMGSWFFIRENPVFEGLPVNQAMRSYYQVPVGGSEGIMLDGKNVQVFVGYGRDHDRNIGAAVFTSTLGKGRILFFTLPGMAGGVTGAQSGMQPVILKRLLLNSFSYLTQS